MTPRALLLTATSAVGLLTARGLDGFGLLPGVTESEELRRTVLDPRLTALGLLGCVVVGSVADRLHRVRPALAATALVGGQVALVVALEELGRELTGAPPPAGGETGLWVAAAVQLVLALVAGATVLGLVLSLLPARAGLRLPGAAAGRPSYRGVVLPLVTGGRWVRGPPRGCPAAHPPT